ncbi:PhoH family protein [Salidesulfovibrio brasiliensis]|uniref:PhoH family protein n=1 Tax=Salidesulfovibrio brasiliensis TaxID=221711 RepID=UPI0006D2C9F4|nr:PhoH family protein [Salidesulfovibrio brasiliensis]
MTTRKLEFDDSRRASILFGPENTHLKLVGERFNVRIETRGSMAVLTAGDDNETEVDTAARVLTQLYGMLRHGRKLAPQDVDLACRVIDRDPAAELHRVFRKEVDAGSPRKPVTPKTINQRAYLDAIRNNDLTFGIGPAGTGKTYLAVAMAVGALLRREVKRIVLTRPAVEAGEKLGFLPGDLAEKINPYLRPLYDALHDMLDFEKVQDHMETGVIEVAPLAFMRGRTLNDAFIILDEAQNTTPEQMKMFLTRLGFGSRAVVTGDVTQIDLPRESSSGLLNARRVLAGVEGIAFTEFDDRDVIRHPLVARIVGAYDRTGEGD